MIICVDFDGTIVDHAYPYVGMPNLNAIYWLQEWIDHGAKIILWTMRGPGGDDDYGDPLQEAVDYLLSEGIELFGINENPHQKEWTQSPKAYGQIYVDDAAFGCPLHQPHGFNRPAVDWAVVGPAIRAKLRKSLS